MGVILFAVVLFTIIHYLIVYPATRRLANDFSSLIALSAQTWLELPPGTRPDFEHELFLAHDLSIGMPTSVIHGSPADNNFITLLEDSLSWQLETEIYLFKTEKDGKHWYWADIPLSGKVLRAGFSEDRLKVNYSSILLIATLVGLIIVTLLTATISYRLTRPIKELIASTRKIGILNEMPELPQSSITEIAELSASFQRLDDKIKNLLNSRNILLSGISHDLRTPLARITLAVELLKTDGDSDLKQRILADIDTMDSIIGQTLQLSKDLIPQDIETIELLPFLQSVVDLYATDKVKIILHRASPCSVIAAGIPLQRILTNLIDNAIRHSQAKTIKLSYVCNPTLHKARISVTDNGIGIDEAIRESVFLPFFKKDTSRTGEGSGLGLSIVQQLVNVYGWKIELLPHTPTGSEFVITVPLA